MEQLSDFVNSNAANVNMQHRFDALMLHDDADGDSLMFDVLPAEFAEPLDDVQQDYVVDDSMFPVLVWLANEKPVAWYDCELFVGRR